MPFVARIVASAMLCAKREEMARGGGRKGEGERVAEDGAGEEGSLRGAEVGG